MGSQISAILPTFNRSVLLAEAIEGLLLQKRPVQQIIIWDDGSTDSTAETVAGFRRTHGDIILYHRAENGGKSRALNAALHHATGDYIWICDDDDIALPEAAAILAGVLDGSGAGLVAGRHARFSTGTAADGPEGARQISDSGYWPDLRRGSLLRHTLEDIFFFQNATLVRRACYDSVGPFSTDLARSIDYDMTVRLLARFPAELVDQTVFLQRKHDGARGPAWARHAAARSEEVWRSADRQIFDRLRPVLPLSLYEAMFDSADPLLRRRAGLLQRATVYARRCDWTAAIEDFTAAAAIAPGRGLALAERQVVIRAMAGKHGPADVFDPPRRRQLAALARQGAAGRGILRWLSRGALWRLRLAVEEERFRDALRISAFLARLPPAPARLPETADDGLQERQTLPPEAYRW